MVKLYTEYALQKRDLENDIRSHNLVIIEHLAKCFCMFDSRDYNHWKQEIANQLNAVPVLKGNKKFPTYKQLMSWTFEVYKECLVNPNWTISFFENIFTDYHLDYTNLDNINTFEFYSICKGYFSWICNELSKTGIVSRSKIYDKIDELIEKGFES